MHAAEHLTLWKHPECYVGFSPDGDYLILSRHRDSELLDRCNWDIACETLKAEDYDEGDKGFATRPIVYHWRAGHWAVGWIEYLCVRADAPADVLTSAVEIVSSLEDYPILDEDRFSNEEFDATCDYWERCSVADRVYELQQAGLCIFAARRDELPDDPSGSLCEQLRQGL